jgi:hypothetical protein
VTESTVNRFIVNEIFHRVGAGFMMAPLGRMRPPHSGQIREIESEVYIRNFNWAHDKPTSATLQAAREVELRETEEVLQCSSGLEPLRYHLLSMHSETVSELGVSGSL